MKNEDKSKPTGYKAFDEVIESVRSLAEHLDKTKDELSFAFLLGGAYNEEEHGMHLISTEVGKLEHPEVYEAAVELFVSTMKKNDLFARLIMETFFKFQNKEAKVVKLSVDSPIEALMVLKNIIANEGHLPDLDKLPPELKKRLPELKEYLAQKIAEQNDKKQTDDYPSPIFPLKKKNEKGN